MHAITRYILSQLGLATLFVTIALTFAIWLTQSLRLLDYIVNRGLPASTFLSFVALLLPSFFGIVLPIATFCAVLFVYHKLSLDSELVVLRAAGLSQIQLAKPALLIGGVITILVYSISLYFLPASYRAFKDLQNDIRNDYSSVLLQEGVFNSVADGITVFVRERSTRGELRGILVHDNRIVDRPITMMAESGALVFAEEGPRVIMLNGNRQQIDREDGRLSLLYFDRYTVELANLSGPTGPRWREPKERYLHELLSPGDENMTERMRGQLIAEGHQRLAAPLYVLAFVMIALAALLSGEFNRRGQAKRLLIAVAAVAALQSVSFALQDVASRTAQLIPLLYLFAVAAIAVSLAVLLRHPRRRSSEPGEQEVAAA